MLAYLLWHRPAQGIEREAYERAASGFHRSLHHTPPAGFRGSAIYRVPEPAWLASSHDRAAGDVHDAQTAEGIGDRMAGEVYEDWYLVDDFTALGILNEAAVAHGHHTAHEQIARRFGAGAGGLYGLLEGHVHLEDAREGTVIWIARPPGASSAELAALLGDGMDPAGSSLWRRALVLGPAPEYLLLAPRTPAGVAPTRLPEGWTASVSPREPIWRG